jgi:hypothetical protein
MPIETHSSVLPQRRKTLRTWCWSALALVAVSAVYFEYQRRHHQFMCEVSLRSARDIGISVNNYVAFYDCLFDAEPAAHTGFGWRVRSRAFLDASPIPGDEAIRLSPAGIYNLARNLGQSTTIYAVVGENTAFSPRYRCLIAKLPQSSLLFVSGRPSKGPWFRAEDILADNLMTENSAREILGEVCGGETFVVFADGSVWTLDSAVPCDLLRKCAEIGDAANTFKAKNALERYKRNAI